MEKFERLESGLLEFQEYSTFGDDDIPRLMPYILDHLNGGEKRILATEALTIIANLSTEESQKTMFSLLDEHGESEWVKTEVPIRMVLAGPKTIPWLKDYVADRSKHLAGRLIACDAMTAMAPMEDTIYRDVVGFYSQYLKGLHDDRAVNTNIVSSLTRLDACNNITEIELIYEKGLVDTDICGSLESIRAYFDDEPTPEEIASMVKENKARFAARKFEYSGIDLRSSKGTLDKILWYLLEFGNPNSISDSVELHGFMTAIVCAPNLISTQGSVKEIFGHQEPTWSAEEFNSFFTLLSKIHEGIAQSIVGYTYEARLGKKGKCRVESWREGFMNGMFFWEPHDDDVDVLMDHVTTLTFGIEELEEDEQREVIRESVAAIFDHFHDRDAPPLDASPQFPLSFSNRERIAPSPAAPKVGRNEKCPCGSGKKYKKCCLRKN